MKRPVRSQDPERSVDSGACNLQEQMAESPAEADHRRKRPTPSPSSRPLQVEYDLLNRDFHPFYTIPYHEVPLDVISCRIADPGDRHHRVMAGEQFWLGSRSASNCGNAVRESVADPEKRAYKAVYSFNPCALRAVEVQIEVVQEKT